MEQTLIGQIDRIIYENEGFFIAALKSGEKISGTYFESDVSHIKGAAVTLKGLFEEHKKHGRTFKFDTITINQNELFFFLNRVVKGFTKKLTADLIEKYGEQGLINILDNDIEQLLEMKGIKKKRLAKIRSSWKQFRSMRELGKFLSPYGVSPVMLTTIATAMKEVSDPIGKIKNNPYVLTHINGIGFKRADEIALKMGVDLRSEQRIGAAMDFILNDYCERQGNSCVEKEKLFSLLDEALEFYGVNQLYEQVMIERVSEQSIIPLAHNRYAPDRLYEAEKLLYDQFKRRAKRQSDTIVKDLDAFLQENDFALGEEQRQALEIINTGASLLFLVGYAGTGKSTTSRAILDLLAERYDPKTFITCALSGIASQRIADTTGYESATIQSLLVKFEDRDFMPYSVILIDESSMINSTLFARLFAKIDSNAVVIIVGDDAQLPPIGAGNVLSDALTLTIAPIVKLTKIYRQSEDQAIALLANDVRKGVVPDYHRTYEDFFFEDISIQNYYARKSQLSQTELSELREENAKAILAKIVGITMQVLPSARKALEAKRIAEYLTYFQVIAPMKGGTLGVDNLNKVLQEYCNPNPKRLIKRGDREYRLMDKVVHIKNENMPSFTPEGFKEGEESSERRIFNGMNGLLFRIDEEEEQLFVFYPNEGVVVQYEYEQLKTHLTLSYALTIHKVQGMEYHTVIMPMSFAHFIMLNTKLLYTAMTRAKKECYIVGESQAFETACRRLEVTQRDTVMLELGSR